MKGQTPHNPPARAAMFLWILGGVQLFCFSCCATCLTTFAMLPIEQWNELMQGQSQALDGMAPGDVHAALLPMAILAVVLGVAPGTAYVVLAFFVKKAQPAAVNIAMLVAITQIIVFGIMFLLNVVSGVARGNPVAVTAAVLTQGSLLALLVATVRWLSAVRKYGQTVMGEQSDPWSERDPW